MQQEMPDVAFLHGLADVAEAATLSRFRTDMTVERKGDGSLPFDPVTDADREAERGMRAAIRTRFPDAGVVGEEDGTERPEADTVFVLDPIDGTRAFIAGLPLWGTLIGVRQGGRPALGMLAQPYLRERFCGDGSVAWLDRPGEARRPLATRKGVRLDAALLSTTDPRLFRGSRERDGFERVAGAVRLTRFGYDCYAYAMVALGTLDLVIESGLRPFDIEPLVPIVRGAGGVVLNWDGGEDLSGGRVVAAGDRPLAEAAIALLAG